MKGILLIREMKAIGGGLEGEILRIARWLAHRGILSPILLTSSEESLTARRFLELGFPVYAIPMRGWDNFCSACNVLDKLFKEHNIAIVQSHMLRESLIGRIAKLRHPEIKHVYRVITHIDASTIPAWRKQAYHLLDWLTSGKVDMFVVSTDLVCKELQERSHIPTSRIRLVREGTALLGAADSPDSCTEVPFPRRVAMVSRIRPRKGHDVLIKGLALLGERGLRVQSRLIGSGEILGQFELTLATPFVDSLKAQATKLGILDQLEFYGYTRDVFGALQDFPVVVLPSYNEATPHSILEALSLRKLVVASDVGGIPEIIDDGINGLLHPPRDPPAFADVLEKVFTTPARTWEPLRNAGHKTWQERYSMDVMMDGLISVYKELGVVA